MGDEPREPTFIPVGEELLDGSACRTPERDRFGVLKAAAAKAASSPRRFYVRPGHFGEYELADNVSQHVVVASSDRGALDEARDALHRALPRAA